jgi:NADPH:quinone reductase-like Zn-dependent oxidoreductase
MRAAVLHEPGTAPAIATVADPVAASDEVLVRVTAACIAPIDRLVASGTSYFGRPTTPYVPGLHGVGVEPDGGRVWFATGAGIAGATGGSMAELVAVRRDQVVALPPGDDVVTAALGGSAIAAYGALRRGGLAAGSTVVVLGANGVVGQIGLQLARLAGARVVAVARGQAALGRAGELGAHALVDASTDDLEALSGAIADACGGGADLVLDPVWGLPAAAALRALAPHGRLVNLGDSAGPTVSLPSALLRSRSIQLLGWTNAHCPWDEQGVLLTEVAQLAASGDLVLDTETAPLERVEEAWDRRAAGRMVLVP